VNQLVINTTIDVRSVGLALLATDKEIARVNRLVVNKIVREVYKQVGGLHPKETKTNTAGFRKVRTYRRALLVKRKSTFGKIWVGGNRISARFGGRMRNVAGGAMAGSHFFPDSFVQTVRKSRGGFTSIWKRDRNKLVQQTFKVINFDEINIKALKLGTVDVPEFLNSELERVMNNVSGRRGLR